MYSLLLFCVLIRNFQIEPKRKTRTDSLRFFLFRTEVEAIHQRFEFWYFVIYRKQYKNTKCWSLRRFLIIRPQLRRWMHTHTHLAFIFHSFCFFCSAQESAQRASNYTKFNLDFNFTEFRFFRRVHAILLYLQFCMNSHRKFESNYHLVFICDCQDWLPNATIIIYYYKEQNINTARYATHIYVNTNLRVYEYHGLDHRSSPIVRMFKWKRICKLKQ